MPLDSQLGDAGAFSADAITSGAARLGVLLTPSQTDTLSRFATLLLRWNSVHNLTAIDSPAQVLTHHLLDSLSIVPEIERLTAGRPTRVLDVGSGGGLPGIPIAVAKPALSVTLVDKVQKKVAFLTQVKVELQLANIEAVHASVETMRPSAPFGLITSRAFASLSEFVQCTRHLVASGGWWCAMKGALPIAELDDLNRSDFAGSTRVVPLTVPGLVAERHLIVMQAP